MTSTQASKRHLDTLPQSLRSIFFPPTAQPERFQLGKAVKGRNEPCSVGAIAWLICRLHDESSLEQVVETGWRNTVELFQLHELL